MSADRPSSSADERPAINVDVLIFGGGVTGLWLIDELRRAGYRALLVETKALGSGQTIAAQGIIHGGLKYTLSGLLTPSARAIQSMPELWARCLAGDREPDLSATVMRSDACYLWRTESLASRAGMIGARVGLKVTPEKLNAGERPKLLDRWQVDRLNEQVISPPSLLRAFADRNLSHLLHYETATFDQRAGSSDGVTIDEVALTFSGDTPPLNVMPQFVVLAAGAGNEQLREQIGLPIQAMQRRPLHMAMARGTTGNQLPTLNGHCVDGRKTRVTITSDVDAHGVRIWQLGGQLSEDGVAMEPNALIGHAKRELAAVLPDLDQSSYDLSWATFRVDRAEVTTRGGRRPETETVRVEGNVITTWPTKMVLAPVVAKRVLDHVGGTATASSLSENLLDNLPHPPVATPPWDLADWQQPDDLIR